MDENAPRCSYCGDLKTNSGLPIGEWFCDNDNCPAEPEDLWEDAVDRHNEIMSEDSTELVTMRLRPDTVEIVEEIGDRASYDNKAQVVADAVRLAQWCLNKWEEGKEIMSFSTEPFWASLFSNTHHILSMPRLQPDKDES